MKITIVQTEIEEAIQNHLKKAINLPEGKGFQIEITATRGANGVTAEIEIIDIPQDVTILPQEEKPVNKEEEPCWMPGGSDMEESVAESLPETKSEEKPKTGFFSSFE